MRVVEKAKWKDIQSKVKNKNQRASTVSRMLYRGYRHLARREWQ